jgi:glycine cleavage system H protein
MRYTEDHEWLRAESNIVTVGITAHASEQLGDVVFVELPEPGRKVTKGEEICVIESVKAASDIRAPLDGEIVAVNGKLTDEPALVNEDPTGAAWFFTIKVADPAAVDGYMDEAAYTAMVG